MAITVSELTYRVKNVCTHSFDAIVAYSPRNIIMKTPIQYVSPHSQFLATNEWMNVK